MGYTQVINFLDYFERFFGESDFTLFAQMDIVSQ